MTQTWGWGAGTPPHRPRASIRRSLSVAVAAICLMVTGVTGATGWGGVGLGAAASVPSSPEVRLAGPAPTLPAGAAVIGPAAGGAEISADVTIEPRDPDGLEAFAQAVSTPGSPGTAAICRVASSGPPSVRARRRCPRDGHGWSRPGCGLRRRHPTAF